MVDMQNMPALRFRAPGGHGGDWRCVAYMSYSYSNNNSTSYIPLDQLVYKGFPPGATIIPIKQASTFF